MISPYNANEIAKITIDDRDHGVATHQGKVKEI